MSSNVRTTSSRLPLFSETNSFQDHDHAFLSAVEQAANSSRIQRVRFWLSTFLKVLILIGIIISLISLARLWGDLQCRMQDHIDIPLPCTPLDVMTHLDQVKRPTAREVWCSAPLVRVDPLEYDCSTLQTVGGSYPAMNVTCHKARVSYRAWFPMDKPASVGTGLRIFYPEVQITYEFAFTCPKDEPKTPSNYPAPIIRSLFRKDYLLASYVDE